ncbi:MAG: DUF1049 domain-containing protein [Actinomycetota bacterium]
MRRDANDPDDERMQREDQRMEREEVGVERRPKGKWIGLLVVAILILVFVLQNRDRANIDFLFWDVDVRIWFGLVIAVVLGFLAGLLVGRAWRRPRSG